MFKIQVQHFKFNFDCKLVKQSKRLSKGNKVKIKTKIVINAFYLLNELDIPYNFKLYSG